MNTSNTSWDDTGFDAESDGFKTPQPSAEPSSSVSSSPEVEPLNPVSSSPEVEPSSSVSSSPQYTRVEPQTIVPPPVAERRSRWAITFLIAALLIIALAGGYIVSTFFMRDPTEQEAFFADPAPAPQEATAPTVDTLGVAAPTVELPPPIVDAHDSMPRLIASSMRPKKTPVEKVPDEPTSSPAVKSPPANALYVVQVFSSPSRDDADEWLQILRERNVADGFITEQRVGGEAWYRVRFGQYSSRQDAEAAAQQLGFSNPWIARVR